MSYAFFSVSDKTGIEDIASAFVEKGIRLISTGGTRTYLQQKGFDVIPIEEITKKPEAFQGRMKSLSFEMASGILFRRDDAKDIEEARRLEIPVIDYVVINFYPFQEKKAERIDFESLIDFIDIGGPSLLRAAAKNFHAVSVLSNASQYPRFLKEFSSTGISLELRKELARDAFVLTAKYDKAISDTFVGESTLRYGENPHQMASACIDKDIWNVLQANKEMSYNNYLDAHHAWMSVIDFNTAFTDKTTFVIVKHNTPCGLATHTSSLMALEMAWAGDPVSAFGGIVASNTEITVEVAQFLKDKFIEVVLAPSYQKEALAIFKTKTQTRVIQMSLSAVYKEQEMTIYGGKLRQEVDLVRAHHLEWVTQTTRKEKETLLEFANLSAKHLKSNAIVLAREFQGGLQMIGAGMGQPNRIDCIQRLAIPRMKAYFGNLDMSEVVMASDAFFPFADSIEICAKEGIKTIVQPMGSIRDNEVIEAANTHKIAMAKTGIRHFKH